jgi:putative membrane protein insertion efficiency factor
MSPAAAALTGVVRVYQWTLRPIIGSHCRFEPSCSHYACQVLASHGALRGAGLAARRILRCNPWHPGGYDPPPPPRPDRTAD